MHLVKVLAMLVVGCGATLPTESGADDHQLRLQSPRDAAEPPTVTDPPAKIVARLCDVATDECVTLTLLGPEVETRYGAVADPVVVFSMLHLSNCAAYLETAGFVAAQSRLQEEFVHQADRLKGLLVDSIECVEASSAFT